MNEFTVKPIGIIETPFETYENMPIQTSGAKGIKGKVILKKEFTEGLKDLTGFSHLILLYKFHRATKIKMTVTPFMDGWKNKKEWICRI